MANKKFEILCKDCFGVYPTIEFSNKGGDIIYKRCTDCRREYERKRKQIQREAKKAASESVSTKQINRDSLTRLRHYLLRHAGYLCQSCGHDHKMNLKLINLDGSPLTDVLYLYIDNMNQDNWNAVIKVYQRCILMCDDCADTFNLDEAKVPIQDLRWKQNRNPKQPE